GHRDAAARQLERAWDADPFAELGAASEPWSHRRARSDPSGRGRGEDHGERELQFRQRPCRDGGVLCQEPGAGRHADRVAGGSELGRERAPHAVRPVRERRQRRALPRARAPAARPSFPREQAAGRLCLYLAARAVRPVARRQRGHFHQARRSRRFLWRRSDGLHVVCQADAGALTMTDCHKHHHHAPAEATGGMAKDPVCGMDVNPATAKHVREYEGETYYFCNPRCAEKFEADPERYLNPSDEPEEAPAGTLWTCPMDPEIVREEPGACPICGMALEPMEPSLDEGPNPELIDMTRRLWISAAFSLPVFALAMGGDFLGWQPLPINVAVWVQLALASVVVLWGAAPFFA